MLRAKYRKEMHHLGVQRIMPHGETYAKVAEVKDTFREKWNAINHTFSTSRQLIETIEYNRHLERETKSRLYNQAILELSDALTRLL